MSKKSFLERLGRERLYCDGATGSFLQTRGLKGGELPERWNLSRPDDIVALAHAYFSAGSDIVNTNTFGANRLHYPDPDELAAIVEAGVKHVREGMRLAGRTDGFIALDIGPTGKLLEPMGDLGFDEAVSLFAEVVRAGADAGADLVLIETMPDTLEAKAAVLAAKENCSLPVCVTAAFNKNGRLMTGAGVECAALMLEGLGVDALGMNCGIDPVQMLPLAGRLTETASVPVICNPNAGPPKLESGRTIYDLTPDTFARAMREIALLGVQVTGGCCGTTPEYIKREIEETRGIPLPAPGQKKKDLITSAKKVLSFGQDPVRIGTRIRPSSDDALASALKSGDIDALVDLGFEEEENGADALLVNVRVPGTDEPALMREAVTALQAELDLPLLLESSDPYALGAGLRVYNGRPAVRFTGSTDDAKQVQALVSKYGALVLDENNRPVS